MSTSPAERGTPIYRRPSYIALVFAGGACGTGLRMLASRLIPSSPFPATLAINLLGAFALGLLTEFLLRRGPSWRGRAQALLGTGLCGGFTTYSTFAVETVRSAALSPFALLYVVLTLAAGLAAAAAGVRAGRALA